jgi:flagellar hook-associated protein 1 FlgK
VAEPPEPALQSDRAGRSFSHYFGLNDLVRANGPTIYDSGARADQPHGFAVGGELSLRLNDGAGARFRDITLVIEPGDATLGQLRDKLNTAAGINGAFSIDPTYGGLRFTSAAQPQVNLEIVRDTTAHTVSSEPLTRVHGLGAFRGFRADLFQVRPDIAAQSSKLSLAQFEYGARVGDRALSRGDGRGAFTIAKANEIDIRFERAGDISDTRMTGRRSQQAQERMVGAETIANEAVSRRSSVEGVNIDEELIQLTIYQQSYNASARLIAAAKEMFDVLANLI